jgi:hypothetical protein
MLMDKPESNMYACNIDTDNGESTTEFGDTDDDNKRITEEDVDRIKFKNSPMVAACEEGYIDIVECLVENGYNIDHSDSDKTILRSSQSSMGSNRNLCAIKVPLP